MKGLLLLGLIPIALTAAAQPMDHSSMPGMVMPGDTQKPTKKVTGKPGSVKQKAPTEKSTSRRKASAMAPMDHSGNEDACGAARSPGLLVDAWHEYAPWSVDAPHENACRGVTIAGHAWHEHAFRSVDAQPRINARHEYEWLIRPRHGCYGCYRHTARSASAATPRSRSGSFLPTCGYVHCERTVEE
jgi:hypothetical protein